MNVAAKTAATVSAGFLSWMLFGAPIARCEATAIHPKRGNLNLQLAANPQNLSPILQSDIYSRQIAYEIYLPLFGTDESTWNPYPSLAQKMEVSKDQKDYAYTLYSTARWSDGTKITTADVKFSFDTLMNPKTEAAPIRSYFTGVTLEVVDELRFKFHVPNPRFNTMDSLNTLVRVFQKKQFENEADFNQSKEHLRPIGSGPFRVRSFSRDQSLVLERVSNWWAKDLPAYRAKYNYDTWTYKIIPDSALAYEKFLKGDLDLIQLTADQYANQVLQGDADKIGKSAKDPKKMWASKLQTDGPLGWSGMGLNQKSPIFSGVSTRKGLAYLVDYSAIIDRVFFGLSSQSVSPFGSNTENTDPNLRTKKSWYRYDPKQAAELFAKDGWVKEDAQPFLTKVVNGKRIPFRFSVKYAASGAAGGKIATLLKEVFRKNGVDLEILPLGEAAFYKDVLDDHQFDAFLISWGGGSIHMDPKQLWSTESAAGDGSNCVSFSNARADQIIREADLEFNPQKRFKLMQELSRILYDQVPYIFLAEKHFILEGFQSRIQSPQYIERFGDTPAKEFFYE